MKLGIIGLGRMGLCLVQGLLRAKVIQAQDIGFTTKSSKPSFQDENLKQLKSFPSNAKLAQWAEVLVLAIKPQNLSEVIKEIDKDLSAKTTLLSIVASVPTSVMESKLQNKVPIVRAMPNTPAFVGESITAFCIGKNANKDQVETAMRIFGPLGKVVQVQESHMDAVTGLSGCGPAYIYVILEALMDAGIKVGLPRDLSRLLSCQTVLGAAKMLLETGMHPAALKDEVTTPAGCTIDGLLELEEGKLRVTMVKAVVQATKKATRLAKRSQIE